MSWINVCEEKSLIPDIGVAVLLPDNYQAAVFKTSQNEYYGLENIDPFTKSAVLCRGLLGDKDGIPVLFSPMLSHTYCLKTGQCLEEPDTFIATYPVRIVGDNVELDSEPMPIPVG